MEITRSQFVKGIRGTDAIIEDGVPVYAFVGRSNVGKSSLINAITGRTDMARVGKKPGKTTEINFFFVNNAFYLADLPGYGYAKATPQERAKLKKLIIWYLTYSGAKPKKVVLILDCKVGVTDFDRDMIMILNEEKHPYVIVANKIDKITQKEASAQMALMTEAAGNAPITAFSSKTGKGKKQLLEMIFS
ncbi:MAG: GTPase [Candidatus Kaiserbacteria bacterium]|nr:GTPase [Candidatus Kaiserbacteria bacterium]